MCRIQHIAIKVNEFDRYRTIFNSIGMTIKKTSGTPPNRQLWFNEGIQLIECSIDNISKPIDHIALGSNDITNIVRTAMQNGCTVHARGDNWIVLPNNVIIELVKNEDSFPNKS